MANVCRVTHTRSAYRRNETVDDPVERAPRASNHPSGSSVRSVGNEGVVASSGARYIDVRRKNGNEKPI